MKSKFVSYRIIVSLAVCGLFIGCETTSHSDASLEKSADTHQVANTEALEIGFLEDLMFFVCVMHEDDFTREWYQNERAPVIRQRDFYAAGDSIVLLITFGSPRPDLFRERDLKLLYSGSIEGPDGLLYRFSDELFYEGEATRYQMTTDNLKVFTIGHEWAEGKYSVDIQIRNELTAGRLNLNQNFNIREGGSK